MSSVDIRAIDPSNDFAFICDFLLTDLIESENIKPSYSFTLYSGILEKICSVDEKLFLDTLICFLRSDKFDHFDEKRKKIALSIANDIETLHRTTYTGTFAEYLKSIRRKIVERPDKSGSKSYLKLGLAMLTLKDTAEKVINYHQDFLEEYDYFYFTLLAGMRSGLNKTPSYIRNIDGLNAFISTKMAQMSHHIIGSGS